MRRCYRPSFSKFVPGLSWGGEHSLADGPIIASGRSRHSNVHDVNRVNTSASLITDYRHIGRTGASLAAIQIGPGAIV